MQPVPKVSAEDVERIVHRDYPKELHPLVMAVLNQYGSETWQRGTHRVRLAALKLADGNVDELRTLIDTANTDDRDVIAPAEYPTYSQAKVKIGDTDGDRLQEIIRLDWEQYISWLWKR